MATGCLSGSPQTIQGIIEQAQERGLESLACTNNELSSPFLLRFHAGHFRISLGFSSLAWLWQTMHVTSFFYLDHISVQLLVVAFWFLSLIVLVIITVIYSFKCISYLKAVKEEFMDRVRVNYFFIPWISCMLLALGVPRSVATSIHPSLFFLFIIPVLMLEIKIYGQWFMGGKTRLLSRVANSATHISIVGNFVGAMLAAATGWGEVATFLFSVGMAHYIVLFITLYQRLPSNASLPKQLHPVFFLFVAAPSTASVSWETISGKFDYMSKMTYFLALFLFMALVVRINLFRGIRFSVAWWACAYPSNAIAIATIKYADEVASPFAKVIAAIFSVISTVTFLCLIALTIIPLALFSNRMFPDFDGKQHKRINRGKGNPTDRKSVV